MIPKIIHYCWFGRNPLPASAQNCIASWREYLPDYTIKEWNEDNFDVNSIPYIRDAYEAKKYAFVSDYARFWILFHEGGLYFDTDVEIIKSFDDIVSQGSFMGLEIDGTKKGTKIAINPGLGLGAEAGLLIYKTILAGFEQLSFYDAVGNRSNYTMIPMVTDLFVQNGLKNNGIIQTIKEITVYPSCYFNPYDDVTGELHVTKETRSIHWYSSSWMKPQPHWIKNLKRFVKRVIKTIDNRLYVVL